MNNSKALFKDFVDQITIKDSPDEIRTVAYVVFENIFNLSATDILADRQLVITPTTKKRVTEIINRVNQNEPIQYILGEADFYGRKFMVNKSVLIPRPETEELVRTAIFSVENKKNLHVLDIGTGSGCISITLALEFNNAVIEATDISEAALSVARENARLLNARVNFVTHNILTTPLPFGELDAIVSNPPYIAAHEKEAMQRNVVDYEPHLALFVPDSDPLRFYTSLVFHACQNLKPGGVLAVEINERFGAAIASLFIQAGFDAVTLLKDLSGKDRIVKGVLTSRG
jgi:release factor glutamine methyltransferase